MRESVCFLGLPYTLYAGVHVLSSSCPDREFEVFGKLDSLWASGHD